MALNFQLSEEQQAIRQKAREAFAFMQSSESGVHETVLREHRFPESVWEALAASGVLGAMIPESHGGNGKGLLAAALGLEAMASTGYPHGMAALTTMAAVAVSAGGSDALKESLLPEIAQGKAKVAIGATEEEAGFNTFNIKTTARQDGNAYRIDGEKMYTSGADEADYILLIVRTTSAEQLKAQGVPKTMGLSVFLMDANADGITKEVLPVRGEVGMKTFRTRYAGVEASADRLVGAADQGAMVLFQMVNPERVLFSAASLGIVEHCLRVATEFAKERTVFRGTPIGGYQSIQHPLADIKMRLEAARLCTYKAAWAVDQGMEPMQSGYLANTAKYLASQLALDGLDRAIETLGGRGFNEEYELIHLWEMARLFKTAPISAGMILNFVAEHNLGLPRSY